MEAYNLGRCYSKAYQQAMLEVLRDDCNIGNNEPARSTKKDIDYTFKHLPEDDPVLDLLIDAYYYHLVKSADFVRRQTAS